MTDIRDSYREYVNLVSAQLPWQGEDFVRGPFSEFPEVSLASGAMFPVALRHASLSLSPVMGLAEPLIAAAPWVSDVVVTDRAGHTRRVYRPLLVYAWLQAYRITFETLPRREFSRWDEALRGWCDDLEARLSRHAWPRGPLAAADGAATAEMLWTALALHHAGKLFIRDPWTDLAADAFGHLQRRQSETGSFLTPGAGDHPEVWWYDELVALQAAADYAVATEDRPLAEAVRRATDYHVAETQPDHATNQPWGLFAFIWNPKARPLADAMLHTISLRPGLGGEAGSGGGGAGADPVTLMLLADALYCLRLFVPEESS